MKIHGLNREAWFSNFSIRVRTINPRTQSKTYGWFGWVRFAGFFFLQPYNKGLCPEIKTVNKGLKHIFSFSSLPRIQRKQVLLRVYTRCTTHNKLIIDHNCPQTAQKHHASHLHLENSIT